MTVPAIQLDDNLSPLIWRDAALYLLDQRLLPGEERWLRFADLDAVGDAIRDMVVRGAPAIGCAAAYAVALFAGQAVARGLPAASFPAELDAACARLAASRPTAVNLAWALGEMRAAAHAALAAATVDLAVVAHALVERARALHADDIERCRRIGGHGAALVPDDATVLTHCNAGALATGGYGTALGVIRAARAAGKRVRVVADETRPYLQGSRLTAWELTRDGFDVTIIPDVAAAHLLARGAIDLVVVGADRIAANGDTANKIGTYGVALAAQRHHVPFFVAAPRSTVDLATSTGAAIPIEERDARELVELGGVRLAPDGARACYPAFDVTPAELITAIITEAGVVRAPFGPGLAAQLEDSD